MSGHTKGKWLTAARKGDDWLSVVYVDGTPLEICQCFHSENKGECEANARLISAAPDLLEALEEAVQWDSHDSEGVPALWLEKARAAIAKAKAKGE